jgi:hypothetical protein
MEATFNKDRSFLGGLNAFSISQSEEGKTNFGEAEVQWNFFKKAKLQEVGPSSCRL